MALLVASCQSEVEDIRYKGGSFVQFADSDYAMPVTDYDRVFEIPVGVTKAVDKDRTIAVMVDTKRSNAIEGYHFTMESHNVVIPAGKRSAVLRLHGNYENIESVNDSLGITLKLLVDANDISPLYGDFARVRLQKVRPFCIDDYVGNLQMTCTFPFSTSSITTFNLESEKVNDSTLIVKKPFDVRRNLVLNFHTGKDDPFDQNIDVKEQVAFTDVSFGMVSMQSVAGIPSYYLPEDRAFVLYMDAFLAHLGSFGSYFYIFEWISPDQALADKNNLNSLH